MEKQIDWTKPIQTRDGRPARLLGVLDGAEINTHVVAVRGSDGCERAYIYNIHGSNDNARALGECIVNVPEKRVLDCWVNMYPLNIMRPSIFFTKDAADRVAFPTREACIHIVQEYTEGEGL